MEKRTIYIDYSDGRFDWSLDNMGGTPAEVDEPVFWLMNAAAELDRKVQEMLLAIDSAAKDDPS